MSTEKPYWVTSTPEQLAQRLVDNVSCATQLDVEKGELANAEDWRRNAEAMFKLIIRDRCATEAAEAARDKALEEAIAEVTHVTSTAHDARVLALAAKRVELLRAKLRAAKEGR